MIIRLNDSTNISLKSNKSVRDYNECEVYDYLHHRPDGVEVEHFENNYYEISKDILKQIGEASSIEINNWLIGQVVESNNIVQPSITAYINTSEKEQTNINIEYDSFEV